MSTQVTFTGFFPAGTRKLSGSNPLRTHLATDDDAGLALVDVVRKTVATVPGGSAAFAPSRPTVLLQQERSVEVRDATTLATLATMRGVITPWGTSSPFATDDLAVTVHDAFLSVWRLADGTRAATFRIRPADAPASFRWSHASLGPRFASFVREAAATGAEHHRTRQAVVLRLADGAWGRRGG